MRLEVGFLQDVLRLESTPQLAPQAQANVEEDARRDAREELVVGAGVAAAGLLEVLLGVQRAASRAAWTESVSTPEGVQATPATAG